MFKINRVTAVIALALAAGTLAPGGALSVARAADPSDPPAVQEPVQSPAPAPVIDPPAAPDPTPAPAAVQTPVTTDANPAPVSAPIVAAPVEAPIAQPVTRTVTTPRSVPPVSTRSQTEPVKTEPVVASGLQAPAPAVPAATGNTIEAPAAAAPAPVIPAPASVTDTSAKAVAAEVAPAAANVIVPGVLLILVIMSYMVWNLMRAKRREQDRLMRQANDAKASFWTAATLQQGVQSLELGSPFRYIAESGVQAAETRNDKLYAKINRRTWVTQVIQHAGDNVTGAIEHGPAQMLPLALVAPVVGLLGAGWVLMLSPVATTPGSVDLFAIGEAVLMTAIGLTIAVTALVGHGRLLERNGPCIYQVRAFCSDLQKALAGRVDEFIPERMQARVAAR